jgi:hypothetical protein
LTFKKGSAMKKCSIVVLLMFLAIGLPAEDACSDEGILALSTKAGTLGFGLEGIARINSRLNAKVGANGFQFGYDTTESGIEYDLDFELLSFTALLDWFPFAVGGFRITGGLLANQNNVDLEAKLAGTYEIGDNTYTAAEVGTLKGELDFEEVAPYVGIGWGNPFHEEGDWSVAVDLGVVFQGAPNINLSVDGTLANDAGFLINLTREEENLENALNEFEFYPVVSLGFAYRF